MGHLLKENISLVTTRILSAPPFFHTFISNFLSDICLISLKTKETSYFFPLYLYPDEPVGAIHDSVGVIHELPLQTNRIPNFTSEFFQAIKTSLGLEQTPEEIFYYIYAVLYSPTYRKRYEEFLKIDFPRVPLPTNQEAFRKLSNLGKELVELHLLKHPDLDKTEVGFPKSGSNMVEKIIPVGIDDNLSIYINKDQYFEGPKRGLGIQNWCLPGDGKISEGQKRSKTFPRRD